jgi:imidazolonepropionase-like amidohydrolase
MSAPGTPAVRRAPTVRRALLAASLLLALPAPAPRAQDLAVRADLLRTVAGPPIRDGVVVVRGGRIVAVGPAAETPVPEGLTVLHAAVATPGLIDAHTCVGLTGYLNQPQDQDQLDRSGPIQPELRAIDAYNARERLVEWVRGFGVTTIHTGHGPGALVSGMTMICKTRGDTAEEAVLVPEAMLAVNLGPGALETEKKSPGTPSKQVAMLREQLVKAQAYASRRTAADAEKRPDRDLRLETLVAALEGRLPLLVTAQRHTDLVSALRLGKEFGLRLVLDGAAEATLVIDELRAADVPVIVHPAMARPEGEAENLSFETAGRLHAAGIPIALQSGFESYVPKTRVVLFEAAIFAAHGLPPDAALSALTLDAARLLGIADRVGSLEVGKHGDLALYDGDPFEYTTHCTGVVIEGEVVSTEIR